MSWSTSNNHPEPQLTSNECAQALHEFVRNTTVLAVATEASSHPSGLESLLAQPYVYSGGGLGNIEECPLQTCIAGGTTFDSITFAAVCIPVECTALDLAARDFSSSLERVSQGELNRTDLVNEYLVLHTRITQVNKFLNTGWSCGSYQVPWNAWLTGIYGIVLMALLTYVLLGTFVIPKRRKRLQCEEEVHSATAVVSGDSFQEEKKEPSTPELSEQRQQSTSSTKASFSFWSAWNMKLHLETIFRQRPDTAALDGLRVGSILWIIFGHVLAIESNSGGGYNNAADFLPPDGFTTTWKGQLLFASRFAVDTFLLISGYLVVHVMQKIPTTQRAQNGVWKRYCSTIPGLLLHRLLRIMPLYCTTLGFYVLIAPHMGSGPFWYQWEGLLAPCREYGWTNLLFVNNFFPLDLPNTETCFYHSWYLALDMQLFLLAPLLVYVFRTDARSGQVTTASLLGASIFTTLYLAWMRSWSINTFDGTAVARYDVEAYAKPHVRAQAYLVGMLLAMRHQQNTSFSKITRKRTRWVHSVCMLLALSLLLVVTFGTITGAYSRRPCDFQEWPTKDNCGSTWGPEATLWYTALSRIAWSVAVSAIVHLCLRTRGGIVGNFLSLKCWTPLSHLSFGAYLVHPIIIFIWQLGNTQKETFRFLEVGMNYVAVCVVSFVFALLLALLVEFPCSSLVKGYFGRQRLASSSTEKHNYMDVAAQHLIPKSSEMTIHHRYGAMSYPESAA